MHIVPRTDIKENYLACKLGYLTGHIIDCTMAEPILASDCVVSQLRTDQSWLLEASNATIDSDFIIKL